MHNPDVVFFGDSVPRPRVAAVAAAINAAAALLVGGRHPRVQRTPLRVAKLSDMAAQPAFQSAMWLSMLLYLPLSLLFWHAPGLVHWHGVPPVKALFFSIVACVRNFGAFLVYGLSWMGVFLLAGVVMTLATALLATLGLGAAAAGGMMVGTAMMLATMLFTSVVFSFRDCFEPPNHPSEAPHDNAPPPPDPAAGPH